jgi:hypothetical protein
MRIGFTSRPPTTPLSNASSAGDVYHEWTRSQKVSEKRPSFGNPDSGGCGGTCTLCGAYKRSVKVRANGSNGSERG